MTFRIEYKQSKFKGYIPGLGEHNVYNAVASLAAAAILGVDLHYALKRLSSFHHMRSHFQIIEGRNQITLVDDTWKSNPASLRTRLRNIKQYSIAISKKNCCSRKNGITGKICRRRIRKGRTSTR